MLHHAADERRGLFVLCVLTGPNVQFYSVKVPPMDSLDTPRYSTHRAAQTGESVYRVCVYCVCIDMQVNDHVLSNKVTQ